MPAGGAPFQKIYKCLVDPMCRFVIADTGGQITTYFKALGCPQSQPEQMQPTSSSRAECTASAAAPIVAAIAAGTAKCRPTSAQQEQQQQEPQGQQQPQAMAVTSQLLVASDGYFSRVRRQCLDDGPPEVCVPQTCGQG
jgi:hypothetical protein